MYTSTHPSVWTPSISLRNAFRKPDWGRFNGEGFVGLLPEAVCESGISQQLRLKTSSPFQPFPSFCSTAWDVRPQGSKIAAMLSVITSTFQARKKERNRKGWHLYPDNRFVFFSKNP
jgi:hypothetical protein